MRLLADREAAVLARYRDIDVYVCQTSDGLYTVLGTKNRYRTQSSEPAALPAPQAACVRQKPACAPA